MNTPVIWSHENNFGYQLDTDKMSVLMESAETKFQQIGYSEIIYASGIVFEHFCMYAYTLVTKMGTQPELMKILNLGMVKDGIITQRAICELVYSIAKAHSGLNGLGGLITKDMVKMYTDIILQVLERAPESAYMSSLFMSAVYQMRNDLEEINSEVEKSIKVTH